MGTTHFVMDIFNNHATGLDWHFTRLRDCTRYGDARRHVEDLWSRFKPYADPRFPQEMARQFLNRYWEMYLGCTLLGLNFTLPKKRSSDGPDIDASRNDIRVLLEATSVSRGTADDAVPFPPVWKPQQKPVAQDIDFKPIVLRITGAVRTKHCQYTDHVKQNRSLSGIPFVIAIHTGQMIEAHSNTVTPLSVQACLGIGNFGVRVDSRSDAERIPVPRNEINRKSPNEQDKTVTVRTDIFRESSHEDISGLLLCDVNPFSIPSEAGGFEFLHNPHARYPLPHGWFGTGTEYWVEENSLKYQTHDAAEQRAQ